MSTKMRIQMHHPLFVSVLSAQHKFDDEKQCTFIPPYEVIQLPRGFPQASVGAVNSRRQIIEHSKNGQ